MRQKIRVEIDKDGRRTNRFAVMIREPEGNETCLADNLTEIEAQRLLVPARKAFLAGVRWFREDVDAYVYATTPDVICAIDQP